MLQTHICMREKTATVDSTTLCIYGLYSVYFMTTPYFSLRGVTLGRKGEKGKRASTWLPCGEGRGPMIACNRNWRKITAGLETFWKEVCRLIGRKKARAQAWMLTVRDQRYPWIASTSRCFLSVMPGPSLANCNWYTDDNYFTPLNTNQN